MSPTLQYAAFFTLAALILIPALFVVVSRNIVRAALWLCACLVSVAVLFLVLGAEFLAAIQVLLYIGGIMVLLLFALLMTRRIGEPDVRVVNRQVGWALLGCAALASVLFWMLRGERWPVARVAADGSPAAMADALLRPFVLPFEVASLLLLAAMIAAIVIARQEPGE